jgi:hypothetical protein
VTLTWRHAETEGNDTRTVARPEIPGGFAPAPHAVAPQHGVSGTAAATMSHRPPTGAATVAATIDAATTNRLVDDVIRRIEKRARIERERSGI